MTFRFNDFFRKTFHVSNPLSLNAITKKNLPCFIGWIAVFIWLYSYFLPMGEFRFQSNLYHGNTDGSMIYYYIWLGWICLMPFLFKAKQFIPKTIYSILVTLVCYGVLTVTNSETVSIGAMVIAAFCIGHIFVSFGYGFFMILNNSEKFYSMVLAVLIPRVLMFGKPFINHADNRVDAAVFIILIIMLILLGCSYFLWPCISDLPVASKAKEPGKAYSLMPLLFVMLTLNDVIAPSILRQMKTQYSERQTESFYFFGILIGILAIVFLQKRFSINISYMLNISLALLVAGFTVNIASFQNYDVVAISAVCFGSAYAIGFINIYYLAGFMTKKFQSIMFYRIGLLLSSMCYFIGFAFQDSFQESKIMATSAIMALLSICIILIFFILSPFFDKMLYSGEWIDDTYRIDVTKGSRLEAHLVDLKLTPSEIEVCKLLLEGYTLRQISGMQSKAYATINTYCTSIYRKLNINSRAELLLFLQDYRN